MFIEWEIFYSSEFKTSNNGPYCIVYCIGEYNAFEGFFVSHFVVGIPATTPFRRFHFNRYINTRSVVILMRLEYFDRLRQSFFISFSFLVQSLEIENKRSPDPHMGMCFCTELKNSFNLKLAISSNLRWKAIMIPKIFQSTSPHPTPPHLVPLREQQRIAMHSNQDNRDTSPINNKHTRLVPL